MRNALSYAVGIAAFIGMIGGGIAAVVDPTSGWIWLFIALLCAAYLLALIIGSLHGPPTEMVMVPTRTNDLVLEWRDEHGQPLWPQDLTPTEKEADLQAAIARAVLREREAIELRISEGACPCGHCQRILRTFVTHVRSGGDS